MAHNFNLTAFLTKIDDKVRWNTKIAFWVKHKAYKIEKVGGDYIMPPALAVEFLESLSEKDFKFKFEIEKLKKLFNTSITRVEMQEQEIAKLKKQIESSEFKEFFNFTSWDKTYKEILKYYETLESIDEVVEAINRTFLMIGYKATYSTIRNRLTNIRNLIRKSDLKFKNELLKWLKLPQDINDKLNERVSSSNTNRIKKTDNLKIIKVKDVKKLLDELRGYINAMMSYDKIPHGEKITLINALSIYLGISTGRRPVELLKTGGFEKIKDKPNFAKFYGQAKVKTDERAWEHNFEIPLLFSDIDTTNKFVSFYRSLFPTNILRSSNKKLTDKLGGYLGVNGTWEAIMKKFNLNIGVSDGNIEANKMRDARSAYALICERLLNQTSKEKLAQAGYLSRILGHMEWDTSTYESYYRFQVSIERFNLKRFLKDFYKANHLDTKNIEI